MLFILPLASCTLMPMASKERAAGLAAVVAAVAMLRSSRCIEEPIASMLMPTVPAAKPSVESSSALMPSRWVMCSNCAPASAICETHSESFSTAKAAMKASASSPRFWRMPWIGLVSPLSVSRICAICERISSLSAPNFTCTSSSAIEDTNPRLLVPQAGLLPDGRQRFQQFPDSDVHIVEQPRLGQLQLARQERHQEHVDQRIELPGGKVEVAPSAGVLGPRQGEVLDLGEKLAQGGHNESPLRRGQRQHRP